MRNKWLHRSALLACFVLVAGSSSSPPAKEHGAVTGQTPAPQPAQAAGAAKSGHVEPATRPASNDHSPAQASASAAAITAEQAMKLLQDGNARYAAGKTDRPHADAARRDQTTKAGQQPFATIVSCSDSRVPVEIVFDCGIGDVFVIRVAGNVCDVDEIGTAEYGTEHLGTPLMVVLGHTKCGAVTAVATGVQVHGNIPKLVDNIVPAVEAARKAHPDLNAESLVPAAIEANVRRAIEDVLTNSTIVRGLVKSGKLRIEGGLYDLASGKVEWLGPHPKQVEVIAKADETGDTHGGDHGAPPAATAHDPGHAATSQPHAAAPATKPAESVAAAPAHAPTPAPHETAAGRPSNPAAHVAEPLIPPAPPSSRVRPEPAAKDDQVVLGSRPPTPPATAQVSPSPAADVPGLLERHMAEELYRQGLAHLSQEKYGPAAERFSAAIEIDPSLTAAMIDLAGVHYLQRDYQKAAELYHAVLAVDSNNTLAMRGSALVNASRKQYPQAREMLKHVLDNNSKDAQTWLDLGDVLLLMGDPAGARQHWNKASEVDPSAASVIRKARQRLQVYSR